VAIIPTSCLIARSDGHFIEEVPAFELALASDSYDASRCLPKV
jgi:hypothetical protein